MQLTGRGFGLWNLLYAGGNRALIARVAQARTPRPVSAVVRFGDCYSLYDQAGKLIGRICDAADRPCLGRNRETVYLRRD
jgi:hypothetical protein